MTRNSVILTVTMALGFLIGSPSARAQSVEGGYDVFIPIAKYIRQGDAERLSAWFADNLEVTILSSSGDASRSQARQIVKNFFDSYTPRSFEITNTAGRANIKYAIGSLSAGGETFGVTIFASCRGNSYYIQQIKITKDE